MCQSLVLAAFKANFRPAAAENSCKCKTKSFQSNSSARAFNVIKENLFPTTADRLHLHPNSRPMETCRPQCASNAITHIFYQLQSRKTGSCDQRHQWKLWVCVLQTTTGGAVTAFTQFCFLKIHLETRALRKIRNYCASNMMFSNLSCLQTFGPPEAVNWKDTWISSTKHKKSFSKLQRQDNLDNFSSVTLTDSNQCPSQNRRIL